MGFQLQTQLLKKFECKDLYDYGLWLTILKTKDLSNETKQRLKECYVQFNNDKNVKVYRYKEFQIPYMRELSQLKQESILKAEKIKLLNIIENSKYFNEKNNLNKEISNLADDLKLLQNQRYSWQFRIIETYLYLRIKNRGRSLQIINQLLNVNPLITEQYRMSFKPSELEIINKRLKTALQYIYKNLNSPILINMIYEYFTTYFQQEELDEYLPDTDGFSSQDIKNLSKNPIWGKRYPGVWYPIIYERLGKNLANEFLEKNHYFFRKLLKGDFRLVYLLSEFKTNDEELNKKVKTILNNLSQSSRIGDRENLILLSEGSLFKSKYFQDLSVKLSTKRDHYRQNLLKGSSFEYNIFQLIKLGDFDPIYFEYDLP